MSSIFNLLPPDCTPELNAKQKKILLKDKEYIIPGGDSIETTRYSLGIDEKTKYLRYSYDFTTGQNGFTSFEVRKFENKNKTSFILFSSYGGALRAFDQREIYGFEYRGNKLVKLRNSFLPGKIDINIFIKSNTPDSIRSKIKLYSTCIYDLTPESKNIIVYRLHLEVASDELEKHLVGNTVAFEWTGYSFKKGKITFQ